MIKTLFRYIKNRIFISVHNKQFRLVVIGAGLMVAPFLMELLSPGVGANIGGALAFLVGGVLVLGGMVWFGLKQKGWKRVVLLLIPALLILYANRHWQQQELKSNRIYCQEKIQNNEPIYEGPEFCEKYL